MTLLIVLSAVYILGMPIILRLIAQVQKKLIVDRKVEKMSRNKGKTSQKDIPVPVWSVWKERISFALKDRRTVRKARKPKAGKEPGSSGLTRRMLLIILWAVGLGITAVGAFEKLPTVSGIGILFFFVPVVYALESSKGVLEARKQVMTRMFEIARTKLGQSAEFENNPGAVIRVTTWDDYIKPSAVEFDVPTAFNAEMGEESFLKQFNQIFGQERTWVAADNPETGAPGWNYETGVATFRAVPPLPRMAKWDAHYALDERVAWSFFPIALAVENGIELPNEETGEVENVLGFDLSGEQLKVAKKFGMKVSPNITTSPMVFVGGGTGGGKSLSAETLVKVVID